MCVGVWRNNISELWGFYGVVFFICIFYARWRILYMYIYKFVIVHKNDKEKWFNKSPVTRKKWNKITQSAPTSITFNVPSQPTSRSDLFPVVSHRRKTYCRLRTSSRLPATYPGLAFYERPFRPLRSCRGYFSGRCFLTLTPHLYPHQVIYPPSARLNPLMPIEQHVRCCYDELRGIFRFYRAPVKAILQPVLVKFLPVTPVSPFGRFAARLILLTIGRRLLPPFTTRQLLPSTYEASALCKMFLV